MKPCGRRFESAKYCIRVRGVLTPQWSAWLEGLTISHDPDGDTVLIGDVADQAALYGLISRVRDLGLTLIGIQRVDPSPGGRDR